MSGEQHYFAKSQAASDALEDKLDEAYHDGHDDALEKVERWVKEYDKQFIPKRSIMALIRKLKK